MLHIITVSNRKISGVNPNYFIQNGINSDEITLSVDDEWYDLDRIVINIENNKITEPVSLIWDKNPIIVPHYILEKVGYLSFSVTGYRNNIARIVTEEMTTGLGRVLPSGNVSEDEDLPEDPDLAELTQKVDDLIYRSDVMEKDISDIKNDISGVKNDINDISTSVDNINNNIAGIDQKATDAVTKAEEALEKAEEALASGGSGTRGTQISLGDGRPVGTGIRGDSYVDKSTGQLWEYVEV